MRERPPQAGEGGERSKESAFARLGRGYHTNPGATTDLEPLLREVDQIALEIRDRESVLAQLLRQTQVAIAATAAEWLRTSRAPKFMWRAEVNMECQ